MSIHPHRRTLQLAPLVAAAVLTAAAAAFATALWDPPPGGDPVPPTSTTSAAEQQRVAASTMAAATRRAATLTRLKDTAPAFMVRTGKILPLPANTPQSLRGKSVSLDLEKVSVANALRSLATAAGTSIKPSTPYVLTEPDLPAITLHLKDIPLMEALLELCSQAGLRITDINDKQITVTRNEAGVGIGRWSASGPAAIVLEGLSHRVSLREGGQGAPADGQRGMGFWIGLCIFVEPGSHVFVYPRHVEWDILVDDKGHSLIPTGDPPSDQNNVRQNIFGAANTLSQEPGRLLVQMPDTPGLGQHIKQMKGHLDLPIGTKTEKVTVTTDDLDAGKEASVAGMKVTIAGLGRLNGSYTTSVSFEKAAMPDDLWARIKPSLSGSAPVIVGSTGTSPHEDQPPQVTDGGDEVTVAQRYYALRTGNQMLPVDHVEVTVPTDVEILAVPVDFQDVLLP